MTPVVAALCAVLMWSAPVRAEEWKHELTPYMWGSGMSGTVGVGSLDAAVDMSFGDILDDLEMGFMGNYRAIRGPLSITLDGIYMGLGASGRGPLGLEKADVDLDQLGVELDVGYEVVKHLTLFAGVRYNDISTKIKATGPLETRNGKLDQDWIDPVIGGIVTAPLGERFQLGLRFDVGGFGVGSESATQAMVSLRYAATDRVAIVGAWRSLKQDYEDGSGSDRFEYDLTTSGPALGVTFIF